MKFYKSTAASTAQNVFSFCAKFCFKNLTFPLLYLVVLVYSIFSTFVLLLRACKIIHVIFIVYLNYIICSKAANVIRESLYLMYVLYASIIAFSSILPKLYNL